MGLVQQRLRQRHNGTSATVVDTLASPLCSPCASTENGFEQSSFPLRRTNHFTKKNDSIDDKALDAVPATEMHNAILDARNVTHATFTADQLRALTRRELQALAKRFKVKANAAVVVRVPSHVIPVRKRCHR